MKSMRMAAVYRNGELAGHLIEESRRQYVFRYVEEWFHHPHKPAISLTLPKSQAEYRSEWLFPFFISLLSEGANRKLQSTQLHIDETDSFGLLLATAQHDTIGAVTLRPVRA